VSTLRLSLWCVLAVSTLRLSLWCVLAVSTLKLSLWCVLAVSTLKLSLWCVLAVSTLKLSLWRVLAVSTLWLSLQRVPMVTFVTCFVAYIMTWSNKRISSIVAVPYMPNNKVDMTHGGWGTQSDAASPPDLQPKGLKTLPLTYQVTQIIQVSWKWCLIRVKLEDLMRCLRKWTL